MIFFKYRFYFRGWLYNLLIEPLLKGTKNKVARYILETDLFPFLDICCGTGRQCFLIGGNKQQTIGLDFDLKMMTYAASKYPQILFICADSTHIPIRAASIKSIIISYALHDKTRELRSKMIEEARRLLVPEGKMILVDFEQPWNRWSRAGELFTFFIERMAGGEHFRNGRQFVQQGGLKEFLKQEELVEIKRNLIEMACSSLTIAEFL